MLLFAAVAFAQQYELGGSIGYSVYRDTSISGGPGQAKTGFRHRYAASAVATEDRFEHFSGEIRYIFNDGDAFLTSGNRTGAISSQSHALSYDVLFHPRDRDERLRPFAAVGVGAKYYRTFGSEPNPQPAPEVAEVVRQTDWKLLVDFGVGVKYRFSNHVLVRGDFRDYLTPYPKKLFVPAGTGTQHGMFHQFVTMFGVSYWF